MEKIVYGLLRVFAVGFLLGGLGAVGTGVGDIWELATHESEFFSTGDKIMYGLVTLGGMTVIGAAALAVSGVFWHMKNIVKDF